MDVLEALLADTRATARTFTEVAHTQFSCAGTLSSRAEAESSGGAL